MATGSVYEPIDPTGVEVRLHANVELTPRQLDVCQALKRLDEAGEDDPESMCLHDMYLAAVLALKHPVNPGRFAQAAHSLRELIEKFGERQGGPVRGSATLKDKVRSLEASWSKCQLPSEFSEASGIESWWPRVMRFLKKAQEFFQWVETNLVERREQLGVALGQRAPAGERLPFSVEKRETDRWIGVRDDLNKVAHHRRLLAEPEFRVLVERAEGLILEPVLLRTFERFDQIDRIIAQGEGQA